MKKYLITGGAGFIGSAMVRRLARNKLNNILVVDNLGQYSNLDNIAESIKKKNCKLVAIDINDYKKLKKKFFLFKPDIVIHFAAESHVDRSINNNYPFIKTNIFGTYNLLEISREYLRINKKKLKFLHISTDEVYGDLKKNYFTENTPYNPSSPYSSSKASSDLIVKSWIKTYKFPAIITNCSNNFGPFQHPEKLIPHMIISCLKRKKLPVYGNGKQIRDWIFVEDHINALQVILRKGKIGESYNIGGNKPMKNIVIIKKICNFLDNFFQNNKINSFMNLIEYVQDRPAHDKAYIVSNKKILNDLKWKPSKNFTKNLENTIKWYLQNTKWWKKTLKQKYSLTRIGLI